MHQMVIQLNPTHSTHTCHYFYKKMFPRTSLVVHWIRIHLPMQGTWVRFLVQEDSICWGASKPVHHKTQEATAMRSLSTATKESLCAATKAECTQKKKIPERWFTNKLHCFKYFQRVAIGTIKRKNERVTNEFWIASHCHLGSPYITYIVAQLLSWIWPFVTPWTAARQSSLSFTTISCSFLKLMSTESVMPSNRLILCHPLLLPSILLSIKIFSNESALHIMCPKYWNFSFSLSPFNEYSVLISFRIDWFDLLAN